MNKNLFSKFIVLLLVLTMSVGFLTGCSPSSNNANSSNDSEDKPNVDTPSDMTFVSATDAVGLSPILTNDSPSTNVIRTIYETLFVKDEEKGALVPLLAEGYENPDENTWVIKLKKDIKFQDGTPFNSDAVKYTFEKILDPAVAAPRASLIKSIERIETPDEYTVVLHTSAPYGIMITALAHPNLSIISPTADQAVDINREPKGAGTGPFQFKEWVSGDHVTVVKNENYWAGTPKLDSVTFKVVPEMSTAVSMLETGEADMLTRIPPEHLDRLKNNSDIAVTEIGGTYITYLGFNVSVKPFDNVKIRQAIANAINVDEYIPTLNGLGYKSKGIIGPKLIGYNEEIEGHGHDYDIDRAKQLLAEAGYPDGLKVVLTLGNTDTYTKIAPFVQAQLKKIGIEVVLNTMDWASYLTYTKEMKHEMMLGGWANVTGDGAELLFPQFYSGNIGGSNRTGYNDPEGDALILKTRTTIDQTQRESYLREANIKFTEEAIWIPLYHGNVTLATRSNLKGITLESTDQFLLNNAYME
jgi:peptide/nickel transport system substrate-binding protein